MSHTAIAGTLRIASGQTASAKLSSILTEGQMKVAGGLDNIIIYGPPALTAVVSVQVAPVYGASTWMTLQVNGSDVTVAAAKATSFHAAAFLDLRLNSAGAEGADRDFVVAIESGTP